MANFDLSKLMEGKNPQAVMLAETRQLKAKWEKTGLLEGKTRQRSITRHGDNTQARPNQKNKQKRMSELPTCNGPRPEP